MTIFHKSAVLLIGIIFLLLSLSSCQKSNSRKNMPKVVNGVLDLSDWNFKIDGNVHLDGDWEFYWKQLIEPEKFSNNTAPEKTIFGDMPNYWKNYQVEGENLPGNGFATYRLKVILKGNTDNLAIKTGGFYTAHQIFVNGSPVSSSGRVGKSLATMIPGNHIKIDPIENEFLHKSKNEADIVLYVSDFFFGYGGAFDSIVLGDYSQIYELGKSKTAQDLFITGCILVMGLYHIILFLLRTKNKSPLYFGLFCLTISLYTLVFGEVYFLTLIPNIGFKIFDVIKMFAQAGAGLMYVSFVHSIYQHQFSKLVLWFHWGLFILFTAIFTLSTKWGSIVYDYWQIMIVISLFYILYIVIKNVYLKSEGAKTFLFGFVFLSFSIVNDIMQAHHFIESENILPIGLLIFLFSQSVLLARRFNNAFIQSENLSHELEGYVEKLQSYDKLKSEFLANTSHELRTPLHGILGIVQSLLSEVQGKISLKIRSNLTIIELSVKRLATLIDDILDFSRLKNKDIQLNMRPVNFKLLSEFVIEICRPLLREKPIILQSEIDESIPLFIGDENRIQQILFNLISNAIKFTSSGSITISASVRKENIQITVSDTGMGIPKDQFECIFAPFEQPVRQNISSHSGTGIGLSITKHIVELHGGEIWLTSDVGTGSQFRLTLPLKKIDSIATAKEKDASFTSQTSQQLFVDIDLPAVDSLKKLPHKKDYRILIVEDDPVSCQVLVNFISDQYKQVKAVENGEDALDLLKQQDHFDAILLDVMLPDISGFEVCRRIREKTPAYKQPIIFLTAKSQVSDLQEAFDKGANDYLIKPFTREELMVRLENQLQNKQFNQFFESLQNFIEKITHMPANSNLFHALNDELSNCLPFFEKAVYSELELLFHESEDQGEEWLTKPTLLKILQPFIEDEIQVFDALSKTHPISEYATKHFQKDISGSHLLVIHPDNDQNLMLIHRISGKSFFSQMEVGYVKSILKQYKLAAQNLNTITEDQELHGAIQIVEPLLFRLLFIQAATPNSKVIFDARQRESRMIRISLNKFEKHFQKNLIRIHRSYLINVSKVIKVQSKERNYTITLGHSADDTIELPISRAMVPKLKQKFPAWF